MTKRRTCLRESAGDETRVALDDATAIQGFSFRWRPWLALVVGLALAATLLGLAACGGEEDGEDKATATATGTAGLELPSDLTDDQKDAVLQIKDLTGDGTEPLATLVSHKTIAEDETRHAELAWAIVAWCVRAGGPALHAALGRALDAARASAPASAQPDGQDLWIHGVVPAPDLADLRRAVIADVVAPCLAALG